MAIDVSEIEPVDTMTPAEAGRLVHKNAEWIRAKLRQGQGKLSWGDCVQGKNGQYNYLIITSKFLKWIEKEEQI